MRWILDMLKEFDINVHEGSGINLVLRVEIMVQFEVY